MKPLSHIPLAHLGYAQAYEIQQHHHQQILGARDTPDAQLGRVMMVEHDPVITVTPRKDARSHILVSESLLNRHGVELHPTDRGGDITYHGPGQLVAYPIVDLNGAKLRIHEYIRTLEGAIIDTLAELDISAHTEKGATGVWVPPQHLFGGDQPAKVAAIGVRVRRWITLHGLAINLDPNMGHFNLIVPCGLTGRSVVSIAQILGPDGTPTMDQLADSLFEHLRTRLGNAEHATLADQPSQP